MRFDLEMIASWIEPESRVLDLGCGEGDLLAFLKERKQVRGTGIERDEKKVAKCIEKGLTVVQGDMNREILDYAENRFDFVILSRTLQQVYRPAPLIRRILEIGRRGIVSFPNFSHWKVRFQLLLTGRAPVTTQLPYQWHDTPNIRVITLGDFERFAEEMGFSILKEIAITTRNQNGGGFRVRRFSNLRATYGIFMIGRKP
ncbi:MAG: methionine biosynthesis protein MetW [Deltaproteobacteria bacterium]|nr:methionine biosynthesis protein MetW [Deltaproteobacteria bacterium]